MSGSPLAQSAELQTRRPTDVTTTDTEPAPMLNRHGLLAWETTCTVNRGVTPAWYQYCGDDTRSVTSLGAQAPAAARAWGRARCRDGDGSGRGEGEDRERAGPPPACVAAGLLAACPAAVPWSAVVRRVSTPFAAQTMPLSAPIPTASTTTRRRQ